MINSRTISGEALNRILLIMALRQTLFPVPEHVIRRAMNGAAKVVVPEMNMGQYVLEIERLAPSGVEVVGVSKMDTTLLSPQEILDRGGLL